MYPIAMRPLVRGAMFPISGVKPHSFCSSARSSARSSSWSSAWSSPWSSACLKRHGLFLVVACLLLLFSGCQEATNYPCGNICTVSINIQDGITNQSFCSNGVPCIFRKLSPPCIDVTTYWGGRSVPLTILWKGLTMFDGNVNFFDKDGKTTAELSRCFNRGEFPLLTGEIEGVTLQGSARFYVQNSPLCTNSLPNLADECKCLRYLVDFRNQQAHAFFDRENCTISITVKAFPKKQNDAYDCTPCINTSNDL